MSRRAAVASSVLVACTLALALPAHSGARARIKVSPLPTIKNPEPGTPVVRWSTGTGESGQVMAGIDGRDEILFAIGPAGAQEAPWIALGGSYDFKLRSMDPTRRVLARHKFAPRAPPPPKPAKPDPPSVGVPIPKNPPDTADGFDRLLQVLPFAGLIAFGVLGTLWLREARHDG